MCCTQDEPHPWTLAQLTYIETLNNEKGSKSFSLSLISIIASGTDTSTLSADTLISKTVIVEIYGYRYF